MKLKLGLLTLLAFTLLGSACSEATSTKPKKDYFFDIASYINSEVKEIYPTQKFPKVTNLNGVIDKVEVTGVNLGKELDIFKKASINKAAFVDMYKADTIQRGGVISQIIHKATSDKANIKSLLVNFEQEHVTKIEIIKVSESAISKLNQKLIYEPLVGYKIESNQEVMLSEPQNIKVEVTF